MKTKSLGFIGGGRITKIFLQGFNNKNVAFPSIKVCETNKETGNSLKDKFPTINVSDSLEDITSQDIIFVALHPPVIGETVTKIVGKFSEDSLFISLAPKLSIDKLSQLLGSKRIVRMIPNATSFINQGYNPVCFSKAIDENEKSSILETLSLLGKTFETQESKLEAYAIVSAMLPTYFWFQFNEMNQISQKMGLTEKEANASVFETMKAALDLMFNSNMEYKEVVDLIPVKPIAESEPQVKEIFNNKLLALFEKIKP